MSNIDVAIVALLVIAFGLVSAPAERRSISAPMVFVIAGVLVGPSVGDVIQLEIDAEVLKLFAEITLVLVLFTDATRIDLRALRGQLQLPARLLGVGLPLTVGLGIGAGLLVLGDLQFGEAALLAAILAPTDAALGQAVVSDRRIPVRIRQALNVESGLNDGIVAPLVTIFLAVAAAEISTRTAGYWSTFVAKQLGFGLSVGVGIGIGAGLLIDRAARRGWMTGAFRQLATLVVPIAAFSLALAADGNGFVASFVSGLCFGFVARDQCPHIEDFAEDEGQLLALLTFLFFGVAVVGPALDELTLPIVLYALLSLTVVRMVPVALSLVGAGLQPPTVGLLGWFGPRGLASIAFVLQAIEEADLPGDTTIITTVAFTVLLSTVAHGLSAGPAAKWYGRSYDSMVATDPDVPESMPATEIRTRHGWPAFLERGHRRTT